MQYHGVVKLAFVGATGILMYALERNAKPVDIKGINLKQPHPVF